mgnify:CR=1 FL=1|jgi:hypothetical protein
MSVGKGPSPGDRSIRNPSVQERPGLDVGFDRGTTVSDYDSAARHTGPFVFTGTLAKVTIDLANDQVVDHEAAGQTELGRE